MTTPSSSAVARRLTQPPTGVIPLEQMGLTNPIPDGAPVSPAVHDYINNVLGYQDGSYQIERATEPSTYWNADPSFNSGVAAGAGQGGWKVTGPNGESLLRQDMTGDFSAAGWHNGKFGGQQPTVDSNAPQDVRSPGATVARPSPVASAADEQGGYIDASYGPAAGRRLLIRSRKAATL